MANLSVQEGQPITLTSAVADPSAADTAAGFAYAWSVTAPGASTPFATGSDSTFSFTPPDEGAYQVSLAVTDKDGGTTTLTPVVTVADAPLAARAANMAEYALPHSAGVPAGIARGPDGNLWLTEVLGNAIARVKADGSATEFALPTPNADPAGIVAGPDGALWFTEAGADRIGRIDTSGNITEYGGLTPGAQPNGIATGPGGALWFAEAGADRIGRISTAGAVTEYAVTAGAIPTGLVAGPDGALWFTERGSDKVGRLTTGGALTEYALAAGAAPYRITVGPDGALWFTEGGADKVGRLTTGGTLSEYALSPGAVPLGITAGTDGNLWVAEGGLDRLARVTPAGAVSEFAVPTAGSYVTEIATGTGGLLWYTEQNAGQVGQLLPLSATEGLTPAAPAMLARFSDANPLAAASDCTATIAWGDGTQSAGTIGQDTGGTFVSGLHTYAEEGFYTITVTVTDVGGSTAAVSLPMNVADAPLTAVGGAIRVRGVEGAATGSAVLATFADADPGATLGDFTAVIDWGDGQTTGGTILVGAAGRFNVTGSHTYAEEGSYTLAIRIDDEGGAAAGHSTVSVATTTATVADAALHVASTPTTAVLQNIKTGSVLLATFTDDGGAEAAGSYTATILWGDGVKSAGAVKVAGGVISVAGSHTYVTGGAMHPQVTLIDEGGSRVAATATVNVARNVTSQLQVATTFPAYDLVSKRYASTITVANPGASRVAGPFQLVLSSLPASVSVTGAQVTVGGVTRTLSVSQTPAGTTVLTIPADLVTALAKGQSFSVRLLFGNPLHLPFLYRTSVFSDNY